MRHARSLQCLPFFCLLSLLLLTPLARADETSGGTDLRSVWHTGQTSRYRAISTRVTTVQSQGQKEPHNSTLQVKSEFTWKVLQANPDGGGTCSLVVDSIAMAIAGPDGKPQIITADKAPDKLEAMSQLLKALTGAPVTITVAPDGQVTSAAGWQSIRSNAGDAGKQLSEKDFIESAWELVPLPGGSASARENARWNSSVDTDSELGAVRIDSSYQFAGTESLAGIPVAMINRTSKLNLTPDPSRVPLPPGATVNIDMKKSEMRSQIMFDLTRREIAGENVDRLELFLLTYSVQGKTLQQAVQKRYNTQVLRIAEE
ncbi:MAG: DUF6263 family protein [Phycisphaerales bacterium]